MAQLSRLVLALVVVATGLPGEVSAQLSPRRIVSTSPSITETLFALGLGDRVVGVSTFCRFPAAVARLPRVGTFLRPQPEIIARLQPDLVFVHAGPNAAASHLAALGIRTATVERGELASVFATIQAIAQAAGAAPAGERLVGEIGAALARVRASVAGRPPRTILMIVGRRTGALTDLVAVGPGSYLDDIVAIAGGVNVLASTALEYPRISLETVIATGADVIVDVGEMGESATDSARRRAVTEDLWRRQILVKAVRERSVHITHDEAFVVPGPRVVDVARTLARWLHGVDAR